MASKYNWTALKRDWLENDYESLTEFKRKHGIPETFSAPFKDWIRDKQKQKNKIVAAQTKAIQVKTEDEEIDDITKRHHRMAKFLQAKAYTALENLEIEDPEVARKMLQTGMDMERTIVGLDKGKTSNTLINVGIKTNIDKLLENASYEDIAKLLGDIRRKRTRSVGEGVVIESEPETENRGD